MRLHYQTKHEIEHSQDECFLHEIEQIYDLLSEYDCMMFADNLEDAYCASSFNVRKEEIYEMLEKLKKLNQSDVLIKSNYYDGLSWTVKEVVDFFQRAYDNSPKDSEYIFFDWF